MIDERTPLPADDVGLLEGLTTTRSIRRYTDRPVTEEQLRAVMFAATRAPTGSNRQPYRFVVLAEGPVATEAKRLIARSAAAIWSEKRRNDGYDSGSGVSADSPKSRMAASMEHYVENFDRVPVLILPCMLRYRAPGSFEGASIYPACQNILLAARAVGLGGVFTGFHFAVESELRELVGIPDDALIAGTITLGWPAGSQGPVRRRPMRELVYQDTWGSAPEWAVDPPGTRYTSAGPPPS
jgi:nitroreductase